MYSLSLSFIDLYYIFNNNDFKIHLIPDKVQMHQAALTEPLSCLAHGLKRIGTIHVGYQVLIIGAGIIGLFWSCLLHLHGLRNTVTISEPQEKRRKIASKLGKYMLMISSLIS